VAHVQVQSARQALLRELICMLQLRTKGHAAAKEKAKANLECELGDGSTFMYMYM